MIIAIDPGLRGCGVAAFDLTGVLRAAFYARGYAGVGKPAEVARRTAFQTWCALREMGVSADAKLVLEVPQVYRARGKKDPNDLIGLALVLGGICGYFVKPVESYSPHDWKGSLDGDLMVERIKGRLTAEETARVELPPQKSLAHNVYDAIGIGLHYFGRLEKRRVIAR